MKRSSIVVVICLFAFSAGLVAVLYARAGKDLTYSQNFYRIYEDSAMTHLKTIDIHFSHYYLSGFAGGKLFLYRGDSSLILTSVDVQNNYRQDSLVVHVLGTQKLRNPQIHVDSNLFYVKDGTAPAIYSGAVGEWRARSVLKQPIFFSQAVSMSRSSFVLLTTVTEQGKKEYKNVLVVAKSDSSSIDVKDHLLKPQVDQFYSTKGFLRYSRTLKKFVYLYQYRNKFQVFDTTLALSSEGRTIDSISVARIKPVEVEDNVYTLASPGAVVNADCEVSREILYVHSNMKDGYENRVDFDNASSIDVYNLVDGAYQYSFYIKDFNGNKLETFIVSQGMLFAKFGNFVSIYKLNAIHSSL